MHIIEEVSIPIGNEHIKGTLTVVPKSKCLVIFVHGSGSSRFSKRNQFVAHILQSSGISTLLFDLLTPQEDSIDQITREYRFDIALLTSRLIKVTTWLKSHTMTHAFPLGYFGASTGAAAALIAAAQQPEYIKAVVSRGGRPDLAREHLSQVHAPTLLIVGGLDYEVIQLNKQAYNQLPGIKELRIIPGASHLFEEPGTLEEAARFTTEWFIRFLR